MWLYTGWGTNCAASCLLYRLSNSFVSYLSILSQGNPCCLKHPQRSLRVNSPVCHSGVAILYNHIADSLSLMVKHHHHCLLYVMPLAVWMVRSVRVSPTISSDLPRTSTTLLLSNARFPLIHVSSRHSCES